MGKERRYFYLITLDETPRLEKRRQKYFKKRADDPSLTFKGFMETNYPGAPSISAAVRMLRNWGYDPVGKVDTVAGVRIVHDLSGDLIPSVIIGLNKELTPEHRQAFATSEYNAESPEGLDLEAYLMENGLKPGEFDGQYQ